MNITPRKNKQIPNERSQASVFNDHSLEMENKSRPLITGVVLMRYLDRHCAHLCISRTCVCVCVCVFVSVHQGLCVCNHAWRDSLFIVILLDTHQCYLQLDER